MLKLAFAGAFLLALCVPVAAQAPPGGCYKFDQVIAMQRDDPLVKDGTVAVEVVPGDVFEAFIATVAVYVEALGYDPAKATRAFTISGPAATFVGVEIGGCLIPPIKLSARPEVDPSMFGPLKSPKANVQA